jgi:glucokinase
MYLGIEIGGTKLQIGIGPADGTLPGLWRGGVDVAAGPEGIRRQISAAVPELLSRSGLDRAQLRGVGIGFGGPVDDATHTVIKSHQIEGWDKFPLADWISELVELPAVLGNDADVAGLAEALFGAGKGLSPIFYVTIGSGIGGGLIINGEIYRGCGRGAAEIGHLRVWTPSTGGLDYWDSGTLEGFASGWGMGQRAQARLAQGEGRGSQLLKLVGGDQEQVTGWHVAQAAQLGDAFAESVVHEALVCLAHALCHVIALVCPRRIIIGGGVSLMGERLLFEPLRDLVERFVFRPFAGLADIVPAALGEEVVVHGALVLARRRAALSS